MSISELTSCLGKLLVQALILSYGILEQSEELKAIKLAEIGRLRRLRLSLGSQVQMTDM